MGTEESGRITGVGDNVSGFIGPNNGGGGEEELEIVFESDQGNIADSDEEVPDMLERIAEAHEAGLADEEESDDEEQEDGEESTSNQLAADMDARYGARSGQYGLRNRRERSYKHRFQFHTMSKSTKKSAKAARRSARKADPMSGGEPAAPKSLATPQMSMKAGIKRFGDAAIDSIRKEMEQLHDRKVIKPRKDLTRAQRAEALAYLMFLKRKSCGKVKARGCADGRKQRDHIPREDTFSPTVSTEAVFLTAVIDALEEREVAVLDIPGAFMQADQDEEVFVRFEGKMAELLLEIDREMYEPYVKYERGKLVLYVELLKALYGQLKAARLFWEKLKGKLEEWGFTINPYDLCVANKMVDGKQCTVTWHVDDLKISCALKGVVDRLIHQIDKEFGKEMPLSISRGKKHEYLGMMLDFSEPGKLRVDMEAYINMVLDELPDEMRGKAVTPAASHLFKTNVDNPSVLGN